MIRPIAVLLLTAVALPAAAATFCATDSASLQNALTTAAGNGEDDTIRIAAGTYTPPGNVEFFYAANESNTLSIEGGWVAFLNAPCGLHLDTSTATVFDGGGYKPLLLLEMLKAGSAITVSDITITRGGSVDGFAPFHVWGDIAFNDDITISNVMVRGNAADDAAMEVSTDGGSIVVINSAVVDNVGGQDYASALKIHAKSAGQVFMGGMTVAGNVTAGGNGNFSNGAQFIGDGAVAIHNSIYFGNQGEDLLFGNGPATLDSSDIGAMLQGFGVLTQNNVLHVDPRFVGGGNYRLAGDSLLRDAGNNTFANGTHDVVGQPRVVFDTVDIGAYEVQDRIFKNGFD